MKILIVDDSLSSRLLLKSLLEEGGDTEVLTAGSAREAFQHLGMDDPAQAVPDIDLILMDNIMPEMDGIEVCRRIRAVERMRDIMIMMVAGKGDAHHREAALEAGVTDYIVKPLDNLEFLWRIRSLLRLKREMEARLTREQVLQGAARPRRAADHSFQCLDELTGIANRRHVELVLDQEWRRAIRDSSSLALIMIELDCFKAYHEAHGHHAADDCLKNVARALSIALKRPGDLLGRHGDDAFLALLPETPLDGALAVAETLRANVESLDIAHAHSLVSGRVTISLGVAALTPTRGVETATLIAAAELALSQAIREGRNRVKSHLFSQAGS